MKIYSQANQAEYLKNQLTNCQLNIDGVKVKIIFSANKNAPTVEEALVNIAKKQSG